MVKNHSNFCLDFIIKGSVLIDIDPASMVRYICNLADHGILQTYFQLNLAFTMLLFPGSVCWQWFSIYIQTIAFTKSFFCRKHKPPTYLTIQSKSLNYRLVNNRLVNLDIKYLSIWLNANKISPNQGSKPSAKKNPLTIPWFPWWNLVKFPDVWNSLYNPNNLMQ